MRPRAVITAFLITAFAAGTAPAAAQNRGDCQGKQPRDWSITIAGPEEPGRRLFVEGRVLRSDGETPVAGATVFVFHTDSEGYYSPGGMDESLPALGATGGRSDAWQKRAADRLPEDEAYWMFHCSGREPSTTRN